MNDIISSRYVSSDVQTYSHPVSHWSPGNTKMQTPEPGDPPTIEPSDQPPTDPYCSHDSTSETTIEATCLEDGKKTVTCNECGFVVSEEVIPALGHDFGDWEITIKEKCEEDGEEERTCNRADCDAKETRVRPKLDHDFSVYVDSKMKM